MKYLLSAFFITLSILIYTTNYSSTLSGSQTASAESGSIALNLNVTGDLHGILSVTLRHEGGNVSGGAWKLTVLPQNADATSTETGTLTGSFTGGAMTLDANGIATAASSVQLTIQSGTGQYEAVTSGGGVLSLAADPEKSTKLGGPLALSF